MLPKTSGIYTITNLVNRKIYVGYTKNFYEREAQHFSSLKYKKHCNYHLQQSYNIYGKDNFVFEILEECEERFLVALEHYWCILLDSHNSERGYNDASTNPEIKIVFDEKRKRKISEGLKNSEKVKENAKLHSIRMSGKIRSKESIEKQFKTRKENAIERGYYMSQEEKQRISNLHTGKIISQETKHKQSIAKKEKCKDEEFLNHLKKISKEGRRYKVPIICIDINNKIFDRFQSVKEASEILNISKSVINGIINNLGKNTSGNKYTFVKEIEYNENFDYSTKFKK